MPPRGVKPGTKRARQYERIKESQLDRGTGESRAEEIAARTVNKERARAGESGSDRARPRTTCPPPAAVASGPAPAGPRAVRGTSCTTRRSNSGSRGARAWTRISYSGPSTVVSRPASHGRRARRPRDKEHNYMKIGYFLSSEEWGPHDLIAQARQGAGGRIRRTVDLRPLPPVERRAGTQPVRVVDDRRDRAGGAGDEGDDRGDVPDDPHPPGGHRPGGGDVGSAARTGASRLGVGSGEALNEHILGDAWPEADERLEMLEEAVEVIRTLWQGGAQDHRGRHYRVEHARIYDLPDPAAADHRLRVRAEGDRARRRGSATGSARLAPTPMRSKQFRGSGGEGKRRPGRPEGVLGR